MPSNNEGENPFKMFFTNYPFISWTITGFIIGRIPRLEWVFAVFLIIGITLSILRMGRKSIERKKQLRELITTEAQDFIEKVKHMKSLTPISSSLVLASTIF